MNTTQEFCFNYVQQAAVADKFKYEVWIGEWALATDVCAHWLGGFNDGNTAPQFQCEWIDCPQTYLPASVAVDFDRNAEVLGPFGSGNPDNVCIHKGKCPTDSLFFNQTEV